MNKYSRGGDADTTARILTLCPVQWRLAVRCDLCEKEVEQTISSIPVGVKLKKGSVMRGRCGNCGKRKHRVVSVVRVRGGVSK